MKITILSVGKLKEAFFRDAVSEYAKRLQAYAELELMEVKDEPSPEHYSASERELVLKKEGERILERLPENACIVILAINGKRFTSEAFAKHLDELMLMGNSHFCFVIGGSLGLSEEVVRKGRLLLSFSDFTFPHQLMRVVLLEQLYRAMKIRKGEPYHK